MNYNKRYKNFKEYRNKIQQNNNWWHGWKSLGLSEYTISVLNDNFDELKNLFIKTPYIVPQNISIENINDIEEIKIIKPVIEEINEKYKQSNIQISDVKKSLDFLMPNWFSKNDEHPSLFINNAFLVDKDGYKYLKTLIENLTIINHNTQYEYNELENEKDAKNNLPNFKELAKIKDKWFTRIKAANPKKLKIINFSILGGLLSLIILFIILMCCL